MIFKISFGHCKVPWPLMRIWVFGTMEIHNMNKITWPPRHRVWEPGGERHFFFNPIGHTVKIGNFGKVFVKQQNSPVK